MPSVNRKKHLVPSAARTVSGNSEWFDNPNGDALLSFLNVTAASGTTPTLNVKIQGEDPNDGAAYDVGSVHAQLTAAGRNTLMLLPISSFLPARWRYAWTIGGTTPSFTFSLSADIRDAA